MALKNRGLNNEESLGLSKVSMTASGVEDVITVPCFLYSVVLSEPLAAASIFAKMADSTSTAGAAGTAELMLALSSGATKRTEQVIFNPPIEFTSGIVVSASNLASGLVTLLYKA